MLDRKKDVATALLMAKSRVAPLQTVTLPRLELIGAVLATRLATFLIKTLKSFQQTINVTFWTDSTVAVHWIRGAPSQRQQFVGNRMSEIQLSFDKNRRLLN